MDVVLYLLLVLWHVIDYLLWLLLKICQLNELRNTSIIFNIYYSNVVIEPISIENVCSRIFLQGLLCLGLNDHLIRPLLYGLIEVPCEFWYS